VQSDGGNNSKDVNKLSKLTENELNKLSKLTEAYNKMVECRNSLKEASSQVLHDFKTSDNIEKGNYFFNPIDIDYELRRQNDKVKENITTFILRLMDSKFNNLVIDEHDVREFIDMGEANRKLKFDLEQPEYNYARPVLQGSFTVRAIIQYIEDKYTDEETITLQQIKEFARHALPRVREHIQIINKTGIELKSVQYYSVRKEDPTSAVIKLINIKLNHVLPSQAEHYNIDYSDIYSDDKIKSLRKYKNGKLKLIFHTEDDMETIRELLVGCGKDD